MKLYQERVIEEKMELDEKIVKLRAFIEGPLFSTLPDDSRLQMHRQLRAMGDYSDALNERIAAFE